MLILRAKRVAFESTLECFFAANNPRATADRSVSPLVPRTFLLLFLFRSEVPIGPEVEHLELLVFVLGA
jgi:hypothetical protein